MAIFNLYKKAAVSAVLSESEYNSAKDLDFSTGNLAGSTLTVGSETFTMTEFTDELVVVTPNFNYEQVDRTSLAHEAKNYEQGRQDGDLTVSVYPTYDTNGTYDLLIKDKAGRRVFYFERSTGKKMAALLTATGGTDTSTVSTPGQPIDIIYSNAGTKAIKGV